MPSNSIRSLQIHRPVARLLHLYVVFDDDHLRLVRTSAHLTKKSAKPPDGVGGTLTFKRHFRFWIRNGPEPQSDLFRIGFCKRFEDFALSAERSINDKVAMRVSRSLLKTRLGDNVPTKDASGFRTPRWSLVLLK
jgi:hypothetical protein